MFRLKLTEKINGLPFEIETIEDQSNMVIGI